MNIESDFNITSNSEEIKIDLSDRSFDAGLVYKNMKKDFSRYARVSKKNKLLIKSVN